MPVRTTCTCCKVLKGSDKFAGRRVKCPGCGAPVSFPALEGDAPPTPKRNKVAGRQAPAPVPAPPTAEPDPLAVQDDDPLAVQEDAPASDPLAVQEDPPQADPLAVQEDDPLAVQDLALPPEDEDDDDDWEDDPLDDDEDDGAEDDGPPVRYGFGDYMKAAVGPDIVGTIKFVIVRYAISWVLLVFVAPIVFLPLFLAGGAAASLFLLPVMLGLGGWMATPLFGMCQAQTRGQRYYGADNWNPFTAGLPLVIFPMAVFLPIALLAAIVGGEGGGPLVVVLLMGGYFLSQALAPIGFLNVVVQDGGIQGPRRRRAGVGTLRGRRPPGPRGRRPSGACGPSCRWTGLREAGRRRARGPCANRRPARAARASPRRRGRRPAAPRGCSSDGRRRHAWSPGGRAGRNRRAAGWPGRPGGG